MATTTLGSKAAGSIIKIKENGVLVDFYVAVQNYESGLNGAGRVLVVRKDCYDKRQWYSSNVNAYASSNIDSWLNSTYKNLLDANIRTAMGTTKIYYSPSKSKPSNDDPPVTTLSRSVFLLSATELGHSHTNLNEEGTALSGTVLNLLKVAYLNGVSVIQWTRSPYVHTYYNYNAWSLNSEGGLSSYYCSSAYSSRPAFTLPSSLYVRDDGSVSVNTAPGTPGSISYPTSINGGANITVSWGASTDAEGNLAGYIVERSTNGGTSWSKIYQGSARTTTDNVAFGTASVMYRVKAYDTEGLSSGWRTGGQVIVVNNNAPTAPTSITVPTTVLGGAPLTVTWGAASDVDGNLAGYSLERRVDGGAWAVAYTGNTLSYTDAITKGWAKVCYRVRAYDSNNAYSGYTTAPERAVNNNTAPVITCGSASGSDLGTKDAGFSVSYAVSDADGDAVTVTENVDGVDKRAYTAAPDGSSSFNVTGEYFMKLLNGAHIMKITASDGQASAVHKLTFTKSVTAATITLKEPFAADDKITVCVLAVAGDIPADAVFTVEVTNNAKDDAPVWEDCTMEVRNGGNHIFTNETAAKGFAFNFRVSVERGASGKGGFINSVKGGFQ